MDEPSMGLAPILVERSFEIIKQVHESGVAMLVVEQNANVSLSIADRGYVLSTGRVVLEGKAADLLAERGAPQGLPWPLRRVHAGGHVGAAIRGRFPVFERQGLRQLVLAGRALGRRARGVRGVPRRLGRERRRVGALGRAVRGGAGGVRRAARRRARRRRGHDVRLAGGERRSSARSSSGASGTGSSSPSTSSRRSGRSRTRRSSAAPRSSTSAERGRSRRALRGGDRRADGARLLARASPSARAPARRRGDLRARARARRADARRRLPGDRRDPARRRATAATSSSAAPSSTCSPRPGSRSWRCARGSSRSWCRRRRAGSRTRTSSRCRSSATRPHRSAAGSTPARRRCRTSTPASPGVGLIAEAGVPAIEAHVRGLVERLVGGLDELGATVATPPPRRPARLRPLDRRARARGRARRGRVVAS